MAQKDYIYEICVSDDCSPDRTWDVLQEYNQQYPGLFKLHRNDPNIGIFENIEYTWKLPTGDVIYQLSGDDECGENWLKTVVSFITDKGLNPQKEAFCIYGNYKCIYPSGDTFTFRNNSIENGANAFRLALRHNLCNRSACYSIQVLRKFEKVSKGRSHEVEHVQDRELQLNSNNNYYINKVGNIYYTGLGVSAHLSTEAKNERMKIWPFTLNYIETKRIRITSKDRYCIKHAMCFQRYIYYGHIVDLLKSFMYHILSFDIDYTFYKQSIRKFSFAIIRRIPHKININF